MALTTRNEIMIGIMGHHGDDYQFLDPRIPTPRNYAEYKDSVERMGGQPATEAQLEAGLLKADADREKVAQDRQAAQAAVLQKLGITEEDLPALRDALAVSAVEVGAPGLGESRG